MANKTYDLLWSEANEELEEVIPSDQELQNTRVITDRLLAFKWMARHYIRYILVVNKLNRCYDQMLNVHKRRTVRKLLDMSIGRLLETKRELNWMDSSEFSYVDELLQEMKLTVYDIEVQIPQYYRRDRATQLKKWNDTIDEIHQRQQEEEAILNKTDEEGATGEQAVAKIEEPEHEHEPERRGRRGVEQTVFRLESIKPEVISPERQELIDVCLVIQRSERARVALLLVQEMREHARLKHDIAHLIHKPIPRDVLLRSVLVMQRTWRGYVYKRHRKMRDDTTKYLIGEVLASFDPSYDTEIAELKDEERRIEQKSNFDDYLAEYERAKNELSQLRAPEIMEDIGDEMRFWIENWFRETNQLPNYPAPWPINPPTTLLGLPQGVPDDFAVKNLPQVPNFFPGRPVDPVGGSALVVGGFWIPADLYSLALEAIAQWKIKNPVPPPKPSPQEIKEKKREAKELRMIAELEAAEKLEALMEKGYVPVPSKAMMPLEVACDDVKDWPGQQYAGQRTRARDRWESEVLDKQVYYEGQLELRAVVDELMVIELEHLQRALAKDKNKPYKAPKKSKAPKKRKGKGGKDLTKKRTQESLFQELVEKGIITKYPEVFMKDFLAEYEFCNYEKRAHLFKDPLPSNFDVKQAVKELCVLPIGSKAAHKIAPLIKSVMIAGPPQCGKRLLVNAVCTEAGAVKFDLSPNIVNGKYEGKKGLKMLAHLISKMSRLLQPSVIYIDGAEKAFYTRVPPEEREHNPKLLKGILPKLVKQITADDQIIVVATSREPWMGAAASVLKTYKKQIFVPRVEYGFVSWYWHKRLMMFHGVDREFPYSCLATNSIGYPLPVIEQVIEEVMTARRIVELQHRPLHPDEFTLALMKTEPVTVEDTGKFLNWYYTKTPAGREKFQKMKEEAEYRAKQAKLNEKIQK